MDLDVSTRILNFNAKMKQPYEFKVKCAAARAREFIWADWRSLSETSQEHNDDIP